MWRVAVVVLVLTGAARLATAGAIEAWVTPGQRVTIDTIPPTVQRATYADRAGWFRFGQLEPGWYRVEVKRDNVTTIQRILVSSQDATVISVEATYLGAIPLTSDTIESALAIARVSDPGRRFRTGPYSGFFGARGVLPRGGLVPRGSTG